VTAGRTPDVVEGSHCRYCPAWDTCPAKTALLARMVSGTEHEAIQVMQPLTPENAADAYGKLAAMKDMVKRVENVIEAYAHDRTIDLGDGRFYGRHEKRGKETLDGDIAYEAIKAHVGERAAEAATKRTVTKAAIKAALRGESLEQSKAATEKAILHDIRAQGGAKRSDRIAVGEYVEKKTKEEAA